MAFKLFSRLSALNLRVNSHRPAVCPFSSGGSLTVKHDRQNLRFTVSPDSGAGKQREPSLTLCCRAVILNLVLRLFLCPLSTGAQDCAVLYYRFTGEKEVDLMSTFVPETFRGQGVAAQLSQAAMDYLVEENLKAHISCWYIKKYIEEHPERHYKELVIT
ncbi:hypothetical protein L3Q82_013889 [Scortum barcoo]|uniref:Uncharacterized protein n=1 Tax=Scortum barcoo TaxID=214431 RepID=A0ACB8VVG2_9TELE|nr:hypothetical protein L3Q82_013889 [Scortum barcoo]